MMNLFYRIAICFTCKSHFFNQHKANCTKGTSITYKNLSQQELNLTFWRYSYKLGGNKSLI